MFKINGYVRHHKHKSSIGRVTDMSKKWSWIRVRWEDGQSVHYNLDRLDRMAVQPIPVEDYADILLMRENAGITDSWREYDDD